MRIDYDIPKIKELSLITDNSILKKRLNDKIKTNANNIDQLIVEKNQANLAENETNKINRTISMISAESITPTNSQPQSYFEEINNNFSKQTTIKTFLILVKIPFDFVNYCNKI